jgi:sensory rhodopsin
MDAKLLQATDIEGGTFSLLLVGTVAASVLLFLATGWVSRKWKLSVTLAGVVTLVAAMHYFQARGVYQIAGQVPVIYRYIDWLVTVPVQVLAVYFFVGTLAPAPVGLFWRLLVVAAVTIIARYMGEVGFMNATLGFLIGIVGWLYILGEIFFGRLAEISGRSSNEPVQTGFFWLRLIVTVGWAIYPLCYFIASFAGGVEPGKLNIVYNLSDVVNQIAFAMVILTTALRDSANAR